MEQYVLACAACQAAAALTNRHLVGGGKALPGEPKKRDRQARWQEREQQEFDTFVHSAHSRITPVFSPHKQRAVGRQVAAGRPPPWALDPLYGSVPTFQRTGRAVRRFGLSVPPKGFFHASKGRWASTLIV
jgi:hypothetical protein